jgi:hypothetical protein
MAKRKQQILPAEIYVYEEMDGDEPYLVAEFVRDAVASSERRVVGTYRLVELGEIATTAVYKKR